MQKNQKRKPTLEVDFHSHILSGLDDGSQNIKQSIVLLECAKKLGIKTVIATPHFYPHTHFVDRFLSLRQSAFEAIPIGSYPRILKGAEVLACEGLEELENIEKLCIEGTSSMLIELPFDNSLITDRLVESIDDLIYYKKINIIIAHANRYPGKVLDQMLELGAKLQINAEDMCRITETLRIKKWLKSGNVAAFGSDAHRTPRRYEQLGRAIVRYKGYLNDINKSTLHIINSESEQHV